MKRTPKPRTRNAVPAALALLLAVSPGPAHAFFQKTTLEGTLGADLGGIWLAVHHVMPTFRVRIDRDPEHGAPFEIGPISKDLAPALGENPRGVAIAKFHDPAISTRYGIFVGDVITKLNTTEIENEEDFAKALETIKEWFLITVRRPSLKFSTARLFKIRYAAREEEVDGVSQIAGEEVDIRLLDVELPFQKELEEGRRKNRFFIPSKEQLETLAEKWYELDGPERATYVGGEHRVVAASDYDSSMRQDEGLRGTSFAIVSKLQGNPMTGGGQNISIYGFLEVGPERAGGTYVESTLASAPFPISVEFNGRFELIKLAPYSNKDEELRAAAARAKAEAEAKAAAAKIELAPDIPENLPPEPSEQPAVAE